MRVTITPVGALVRQLCKSVWSGMNGSCRSVGISIAGSSRLTKSSHALLMACVAIQPSRMPHLPHCHGIRLQHDHMPELPQSLSQMYPDTCLNFCHPPHGQYVPAICLLCCMWHPLYSDEPLLPSNLMNQLSFSQGQMQCSKCRVSIWMLNSASKLQRASDVCAVNDNTNCTGRVRSSKRFPRQ